MERMISPAVCASTLAGLVALTACGEDVSTDASQPGPASDAATTLGADSSSSPDAAPTAVDAPTATDDATDVAATATILDPTGTYGGKTYAQWGSAWYKWLLELPGPAFPVIDPTGSLCAADQPAAVDGSAAASHVFFLAGAMNAVATRKCTVPAGQMLFIPIAAWMADNGGVPEAGLRTDQQCQSVCATFAAAQYTLTLEMDGKSYGSTVSDFAPYLTVWTQFSYTVPATPGNFYATFFGSTFTGTVPVSFAGGYWILLAPLSAGSHTIHFTEQQAAVLGMATFSADVTYDLTVQ